MKLCKHVVYKIFNFADNESRERKRECEKYVSAVLNRSRGKTQKCLNLNQFFLSPIVITVELSTATGDSLAVAIADA